MKIGGGETNYGRLYKSRPCAKCNKLTKRYDKLYRALEGCAELIGSACPDASVWTERLAAATDRALASDGSAVGDVLRAAERLEPFLPTTSDINRYNAGGPPPDVEAGWGLGQTVRRMRKERGDGQS